LKPTSCKYVYGIVLILACLSTVCSPPVHKTTVITILDLGQPLPIILTENSAVDTTSILDSIKILPEYPVNTHPDAIEIRDIALIRMVTPIQPLDNSNIPIMGTVWVKALFDSAGIVRKSVVVRTNDVRLNKCPLCLY